MPSRCGISPTRILIPQSPIRGAGRRVGRIVDTEWSTCRIRLTADVPGLGVYGDIVNVSSHSAVAARAINAGLAEFVLVNEFGIRQTYEPPLDGWR